MAEKQNLEEYHFKAEEVVTALREAGYELPDGSPKITVGSDESHNALVLRFGVKAYDRINRAESCNEEMPT